MCRKNVTVGCALFVDGHAGAAGEMQRIGGDGFHGIEHHDVVKIYIGAFGNATHFIYILGVALFCKGQVFARLNLCAFPCEFK